MSATLTYNGTVLSERVTDTSSGATYTNSYTANIPSLVAGAAAYVGFGGGTGGATVTQDLRSWTYAVESSGKAATPTFSPAGGTYSSEQSVKLSSASSGTVICYNTTGAPKTNGSNGCSSGTPYTGPITVSASETLYAVAGGSGYGNSPIGSAKFVIGSSEPTQAVTPKFTPAAGTYTGSQNVYLSSSTSGSVICYDTTGNPATNGSNGCASGTLYTGPVTVASNETLYAVAGGSGYTSSSVASANYVIQSAAPPSSSSAVINFPSGFGSHPSTLFLNNNTAYAGSSIQLTDTAGHHADNVWFETPVNEQAFTTTFNFHFNCSVDASDCGDGLGFMMICACSGNPTWNPSDGKPGYTYSGFSSGQFSWSQCVSPFSGSGCPTYNSMLVKFDLYNNQTNLPGANITGFYVDGEYPQAPYNLNTICLVPALTCRAGTNSAPLSRTTALRLWSR